MLSAKERLTSAASYLWILFFLPLLLIPGSRFGRFHANQALLNLIWGIVFGLLGRLIPGLNWLFSLVLAIYPIWGIVTAFIGQERPFPVIGKFVIIPY